MSEITVANQVDFTIGTQSIETVTSLLPVGSFYVDEATQGLYLKTGEDTVIPLGTIKWTEG